MEIIGVSSSEESFLKDLIVTSLEDDKAIDIEVIDLQDKTDIAKYMIIATGRSDRQIRSMADHIMQKLKESEIPHLVEGMKSKDWVLVDIFDIIVHIFKEEVRKEFDLESIWKK